jgi:ferric-dicitrate binding protein FerR (iron transport regulator)
MDCEQALQLLSADWDRETQPDESVQLRAHLQECASCRASAEAFRLQDADLHRLFGPRRRAAAAVADRVIAQLPVAPSRTSHRLVWWPILVSAAAGFLLAVLVFRPWEKGVDPYAVRDKNNPEPGQGMQVATKPQEQESILLAVANGAVEFLAPGQEAWQALKGGSQIPLGSRVRTREARCEFDLTDGSEVRLNHHTELWFTASRDLKLIQGQILARVVHAPTIFRIAIPEATITALGTEFDVLCKPLTLPSPPERGGEGRVRGAAESVLTVLEGSTKFEGKGHEQIIKTGEAATIIDGEIVHKQQVQNLLQIKSWTNEILMRKGRNNEELAKRVNDLLAQLGSSKTEFLDEQEIRGLGDHCVLPLTRFLQSERSRADEGRRQMAARILADLAQPWSIPDLISLLGDSDQEIRYNAAKALKRLTQQTFGRQPEDWRKLPATACEEARRKWQRWWQENKQRYPQAFDSQP